MATDLVNKFNRANGLLHLVRVNYFGAKEVIEACSLYGYYKAHYGRRKIKRIESSENLSVLSMGFELSYKLSDSLSSVTNANYIKESGSIMNDFFLSSRFSDILCKSSNALSVKPVFSYLESEGSFTSILELNFKRVDGSRDCIELVFNSSSCAGSYESFIESLTSSILLSFCNKLCSQFPNADSLRLA